MTESELRTLPRKLAERAADELWNDLSDFEREIDDSEIETEYTAFIAAAIGPVEAVIREAIEQTLEEAERGICPLCSDGIPLGPLEGWHIVRWHTDATGAIAVCRVPYAVTSLTATIRSLKPAKPEETNGS